MKQCKILFLPCLLLSVAYLLSACQKPQMPETTSSSVAESESLPMSSSASSSCPKSESNPKPASSSKPTSTSSSRFAPSSSSSTAPQAPPQSSKPQTETPPTPTEQRPTSQQQTNPPAETPPPPPPTVDAGTCIAEARAYALGKGLTEDRSLNIGNSGYLNPPDISALSQDSVISDLKYCIDVYASYSPDDPSLVHFNIVQSGNLIYVLYQ